MANSIEGHQSFDSQRRTARGSTDHTNPNFIKAPRITPPGRHTYRDSHPKKTVIGHFLGTNPGIKDLRAARRAIKKATKPELDEAKRSYYGPSRVLKDELQTIDNGEGFEHTVAPMVDDPKLRRLLNDKRKKIYHKARDLQERYDEDPEHLREVNRALQEADDKYEHLVEGELNDLRHNYRDTKQEVKRKLEENYRAARDEIYGQDKDGDEPLSLDTFRT